MFRRLGLAIGVPLAGLLVWANLPAAPLPAGATASRVVVHKSARVLTLLAGEEVLATYPVSLGADPVGHKVQEGDERTPEGVYELDYHNPTSMAHLSIHVTYPQARDREHARTLGVDPGGMIMIHGIRNGLGWLGRLHRWWDWTDGCVAVTNAEMNQIYDAVADGTPIELLP